MHKGCGTGPFIVGCFAREAPAGKFCFSSGTRIRTPIPGFWMYPAQDTCWLVSKWRMGCGNWRRS
ncbi:hypothetical protein D3C75_1131370 [compost metagenome]